MKYRIDVKLIGYEEVVVEAENEDEAYDRALNRFWEIYEEFPAKCLRHKETEMTILYNEED